ncbi:MAG: hypothetical protein ABL927_02290 [Bdellovibrionales bacterium]
MDLIPSFQIISGFSEIKSEIRTKTRTSKSQNELRLWFTLTTDGTLYAHDYHDLKYCIALAIKTSDGWIVRLDERKYGYKLIYSAVTKISETELISKLSSLYEDYGYYTY